MAKRADLAWEPPTSHILPLLLPLVAQGHGVCPSTPFALLGKYHATMHLSARHTILISRVSVLRPVWLVRPLDCGCLRCTV